MALLLDAPLVTGHPTLYRWTSAEYDRLAASGILSGRRTELLDGLIVEMSPINPPHASTVDELRELLRIRLSGRIHIRQQNPVAVVEGWTPDPDLALVRPPGSAYRTRHPTPADVLLLIEVADSSLDDDVKIKLPGYARGGIQEVWVIDIQGERIWQYHGPDASSGEYRFHQTVERGDTITCGALGAEFRVDEVFGSN
jgi:Uma2 family endonuclease